MVLGWDDPKAELDLHVITPDGQHAYWADPVMAHVLEPTRDSFMINYGSGGMGAEVVANRLGVGPMHDCLSCAYEEFFLSSHTVGDVAMLVDKLKNEAKVI